MKWLQDNWIIIAIIVAIIWGFYDLTHGGDSNPNSECTEYETTSQGTFCTE
ncbi:hypothetical protein P4639_14280 [Priestia megaterium]|uniref:hypothetical protein n=1 Tax=Priestia megaterium TaxID=1404 RepID=UPI002E213EC3|nr:hypothetical protein [Priestia megaterium]